jgi:23S rRNA pseudouridine2605 synthase
MTERLALNSNDKTSLRVIRWMSQLGLTSRRDAERWILDGRVAINGELVAKPGAKIDPSCDVLQIDGKKVKAKLPPKMYWLLNKPKGYVVSQNDEKNRSTIFDLPQVRKSAHRLNSVGRLDLQSEGLLLLTNDGDLHHCLTHPKFRVLKCYTVVANGKLSKEQVASIRAGTTLDDGLVKDVDIKSVGGACLGKTSGGIYEISVTEGRNRLVRRLFEHYGLKVVRLFRHTYGPISLPSHMKPGQICQLSAAQIAKLKACARPKSRKDFL